MTRGNVWTRRVTAAVLAVMLCLGEVCVPGQLAFADNHIVTTSSDLSPVTPESPETTTEPGTGTETDAPQETAKPTEGLETPDETTEAPQETPAVEPTPENVAQPSDAPEVTEEPTMAPEASGEETVAPQETEPVETTPENTVQPTEEIEETTKPTNGLETTEEPVPASPSIIGLTAANSLIQLGETAVWSFAYEAADHAFYTIKDPSGQTVGEGDASAAGEVSFAPSGAGIYTLTLTASAGEQSVSASAAVAVIDGACSMTLTALDRYAVAESKSMQYEAAVSGGCAPYTLVFDVRLGGASVHSETAVLDAAGTASFGYMPLTDGEYAVSVTVTDAAGQESSAEALMPVAVNLFETAEDWDASVSGVRLTGDWREDLVAVARTQIGVAESTRNFIINEQGEVAGYTRYGHWYGANYSEWCAMFVSFCLHYAKIPAAAFPQEAGCSTWQRQLSAMGIYEADTQQYVPERGDLVFFSTEGSAAPEHVGIVTRVTEDSISTIEGNRNHQVQERSYKRADPDIAGYASMRRAMDRAGILEKYEQIDVTVDLNAQATEKPAIDLPPAEKTGEAGQLDVTVDFTSPDGLTYEHDEVQPSETSQPTAEATAAADESEATTEPSDAPEVADAPAEEHIFESAVGETITLQVPLMEKTEYQWQRSLKDGGEWESIRDDAIATGWDTCALSIVVTEENAQYQYRCLIRQQEEPSDGGLLSVLFGISTASADMEDEWVALPQVFSIALAEESGGSQISISGYTQNLLIYNYIYYTNSDGKEMLPGGGSRLEISGNAPAGVNILIGDQADGSAGANQAPIAGFDIALGLADSQNTVTVYPVNGGNNDVKMTVSGAASMAKLVVEGSLSLTLNADLTIDEAALSSGAALVVNTNGHTLTIGTLTGGEVTLNGNGTVVVRNALRADSLTVDKVTLNGSGTAGITAATEISVNSASIQRAALFGFDASAQGECRLSFSGSNTLSEIRAVGAGDGCAALVDISGLSSIGSYTGINIICDYAVAYTEAVTDPEGPVTIQPGLGWPTSYRATSTGLNNAVHTIIGSRAQTDAGMGAYTESASGTLALPDYAMPGYTFGNWQFNGAGEGIVQLSAISGDVTLQAVLVPYDVTVVMDLGYDPSALTNDTVPARTTVQQTCFGQTVALEKPVRFGYQFKGWAVPDKMAPTLENEYVINNMEHLAAPGDGETAYSLTLEAQWSEDVFPVYLNIPESDGSLSSADLYIALVDEPGESDWMLIGDFLAEYSGLFKKSTENAFTIANNEDGIRFGETLDDWFARLGGQVGEDWGLPVLRLVQDGTSKEFTAWQASGVPMTGAHAMTNVGEYGLLHTGGALLEEYQAMLHTSQPVTLTAQFVAGFTLTVNGLNSSWEIWLEDKGSSVATKKLEADASGRIDQVMIPLGTKLHWRLSKSSADFGLGITPWAFEYATGFDFDIVENPYAPANDAYIDYVFTMPTCNVTATLDDETVWINLAHSPITFERKHTYNNRTLDGFWYNRKLTELTPIYRNADGAYFYAWDFNARFHVTSANEATQNQLTLVDAMTVVLKECNLQPTSAFMSDAVDRKLAGTTAEGKLAKTGTAKYGNIVISTTAVQQYAVNLIVQGTNTIGAIFPNNIKTEVGYTTTLKVSGENNGVLNLGGLWGTYKATLSNLTINSIETNSEYLCAVTTGGEGRDVELTFSGCVINAPEKRVGSRYSPVKFSNATTADVASTYGYSGVELSGKSFVRIRGNAESNHRTTVVDTGCSLLVEGNLTFSWNHGTATATVKGALVVKGSRCDLGNLSMSGSGALIVSNIITLGKTCTVSGGTIVTNQIMNTPYSVSHGILADSNGDNAYLATYAQDAENATVYNFNGGNIYLLGRKYSASLKASDAANPVSSVIDGLLDENGALVGTSVSHATAYSAVQAATATATECFVLGNSAWTSATSRSRSVSFAGSKIYAAGNITLFNDTNVSAGSIECAGVLSSKHTLNVTGGSITAQGVGNAYNITTAESGLYRYAKTNITGGTLVVDGLGAVAAPIAGVDACSVVTIGSGASIRPRTGDAVHVRNVLYVNYVGSEDAFELPAVPAQNPRSLIFEADVPAGSTSFSGLLTMNGDAVFAQPKLADTGADAAWAYDAVDGTSTGMITANGYVNGTDQDGFVYDDHDFVALYAVKDSYPLLVQGTYNGGFTVSVGQDDAETVLTANGSVDAPVARPVTITLDDEARFRRTVVWYKDTAGVPVNVLSLPGAVMDEQNRTITFPMPSFDVEVWITEELTLDLYRYPISFTQEGFRVEWDKTRDTSDFAYAGDLRVEQSNITTMKVNCWDATAAVDNVILANGSGASYATTNYFRFEAGADDLARTVTLHQIQQTGGADNVGNLVADGVDARLVIDGIVQVTHINVPENASIDISGKAGQNSTTDVFYVYQPSLSSSASYAIGTLQGKAGDVALHNMRVLVPRHSTMVYSQTSNPAATFLMENCTYVHGVEYAYSAIVQKIGTVKLVGSTVEIIADTGHSNINIAGVTTFEAVDSTIRHTIGSSTGASNSFFNGAKNVTFNNTQFEQTWRSSTSSANYQYAINYGSEPTSFVLTNGSSYTSNYRQLFKKLVLDGDSAVSIQGDASETVLFCKDLTVNSGTVEADNIIISGFYTGDVKDETAVLAALEAGTSVITSGTLTMNGGMVSATGFIGGDANAVINVAGGTLEAKEIGTSGLLYGFAQYIPRVNEPYFYTSSVYTSKASLDLGATVNISDGTVNVAEDGYLGGVNAQVNVTGGLVQLAPGSLMGMNAEQENAYLLNRAETTPATVTITGGKVEHTGECIMDEGLTGNGGSISTPYGTVSISGSATGVHVHDLVAEHGSITISDTGNEYYDNPYAGEDLNAGDEKINVRVDNLLQAGSSLSLVNATVYAETAYVNPAQGETAELSIIPGGNLHTPALYVNGNYGKAPQSTGASNIEMISYQYIHGNEKKSVVYVLNQEMCPYADNYTIVNDNVNGYTYTPAAPEIIPLTDPVWMGRVFLGWYTDPSFSEESRITELSTDMTSGYVLYAKWAYDTVRFSVIVPATLRELSDAGVFQNERTGIEGYWDEQAQTFTFRKTVDIPYGSSIVSGLELDSNYQLSSLRVSSVQYNENDYADQAVEAVNTGIYELYLDKVENNVTTKLDDDMADVTIELMATGTVKKRLFLTLDLNLNGGYPVDAAFPAGSASPEEATATTWTSAVETGQNVGSAEGFVIDGGMVTPTAVGYDFLGWYTTAEWAGDGAAVLPEDVPTNHATYYAHWQPKTYLVAFDAQEGNLLTADGGLPTDQTDAQTLFALIKYDAPLSSMLYVTESDGLWSVADEQTGRLPAAWKTGEAFSAWYADADVTQPVADATCFNVTSLTGSIDVNAEALENPDGTWTAGACGAQFTPVYAQTVFRFHANGGYLKDGGNLLSTLTAQRTEHQPFPGYTDIAANAPDSSVYDVIALHDCDCGSTQMAILSTTAQAFEALGKSHAESDYRHAVQRVGYTFCGWYESPEAAAEAVASGNFSQAAGTVAQYPEATEVDLYAAWAPNSYTVNLQAPADMDAYSGYSTGSQTLQAHVTVGQSVSDAAWPGRADENWYAYNRAEGDGGDDKLRRYLLGYTFDQLDPGDSRQGENGYDVYLEYARTITKVINAGCVFTGTEADTAGTVFKIPMREYDISTVPDYPDGAEFDLYAVYRERSLVFIEKYELDGVSYQKVLSSGPVDTYDNYPARYAADTENGSYAMLRDADFTLKYWVVNGSEGTIFPSTEEAYRNNLEQYKTTAQSMGAYDVNVYTVYTANVEIDRQLIASTVPTENRSYANAAMPGSIREDVMSYTLELPEGFHLVDNTEMAANRFDPAWNADGQSHTANDTAAIWMELKDTAGTVHYQGWLQQAETPVPLGTSNVSKDWKIELTMYHSSVISDTREYLLPIEFSFAKETDQSVALNVTVVLKPTLYQVNYQAILPDNPLPDVPLVIQPNDLEPAQDGRSYVSTQTGVAYGSELMDADQIPSIEGYSWTGAWSYHETEWTDGTFTMPVEEADQGVISLVTGYVRNGYELLSDEATRRQMTIFYDNSAADADTTSVPYRSTVTMYGNPKKLYITRGSETKTVAEWVADGFVTQNERSYSFVMPAEKVRIAAYTELEGESTLTACETTHAHAAGETDEYTFSFADGNAGAILAGKQLYLVDVTVDGLLLDSKANVTALAPSAGSDYANSTFAFTMSANGGAEQDVKNLAEGTPAACVEIDAASTLTFRLYNANALTIPGMCGSLQLVFATSDTGTDETDTLTITLDITRVASQLNVTVPLVIVMKTNIDGGSAKLPDESYALDNDSSMRVQLETVSIADGGSRITQADDDADLNAQRDQYRVQLSDDWLRHDLYADGETGEKYNPIDSIATSPMTFVTWPEEDRGVHMTTITYTVAIPEENETQGSAADGE
ncbi:MAG: CHAP domain-containing protein [Clostridiales bacterium]|nr:CHAP domain-containing protein [Clostridiales bacterium]